MANSSYFRELRQGCYIEITEQPAAKLQRFRYASEVDGSRSVGSITGKHSTPERKTYPTIRVHGYKGPMLVMLSLVNPEDNLVHPHAITGNDPRYQCKNGVIYMLVDGPDVVFNNIGILCVKSKTDKDVTSALKQRQSLKIDPFKAGFPHIDDHRRINFSAVRLCFTVSIPEGEIKPHERDHLGRYNIYLKPVASSIVYDAKKLSELKIIYLNKFVWSMQGGTELALLCEKYTGANPDVMFAAGDWEAKAKVNMYHKQNTLVVVAPPYRDQNCKTNVKVNVYLQRVSPRGEVERSAPVTTEYVAVHDKLQHPSEAGVKRPPPDYLDIKQRKRTIVDPLPHLLGNSAAAATDDSQQAMAQWNQLLDLINQPPAISNYQVHTGSDGSIFGNPADQLPQVYLAQHSSFVPANPFSQQMETSVHNANLNMGMDVNASTSNINQFQNSSYDNNLTPLGFCGPIMPNVHDVHFFQSGSSTPVNENHFLQMLPAYGAVPNMNPVDLNSAQMPNLVQTASTSSYNQMPDVLSPMSQDGDIGDFKVYDENGVVNPQYLECPVQSDVVVENMSDELKKLLYGPPNNH